MKNSKQIELTNGITTIKVKVGVGKTFKDYSPVNSHIIDFERIIEKRKDGLNEKSL